MGEVRSALQKEIRRGKEREALFWLTEIDLAGYGGYAFRTLRLIASEDVGLAWPEGPAVLAALEGSYLAERKREGKQVKPSESGACIYLAHAAMLLCRAPKSRAVDNALVVLYDPKTRERMAREMEIPPYALDHHTARGRSLGKSIQETYDESYRIEDEAEDVDDPYKGEAREIDLSPMSGQADHRRLMAALHIAYAAEDERRGGKLARSRALRLASRRFRRPITSSAQLTNAEARWLLGEMRQAA